MCAVVVTGHVRGYGDVNGDLAGGDFNVVGHVTCLRVDPKPDSAVTGPGARASIKHVVYISSCPLAGEPYNPVDQGDYVVNDALDQP